MSTTIPGKQFTFPKGHTFHTEDGQAYTVTGFLGRGGQGEAYRVQGAGGEYAVKFYNQKFAHSRFAEQFRKNIQRNVDNGVPQLSSGDSATQFIWPMRMIRPEKGSFGYLMNLFPKGYESFGNVIMKSKKDPDTGDRIPVRWKSWFTCVTAALNLVRAFEILHASGLSYQDLNEGGFSFDMNTGNVVICDCDNVAPDGVNLGILGVVNYMAPEAVCRKTLPNRHTDEYSLAVILFRLFLGGHPMEGRESRSLHNDESLSRTEADSIIYGKQPHYCLASYHNSNLPDPQLHADVIRQCLRYPLVLMDAFEQVFTEGVGDPSRRLTATEWRKVLLEVRDSLVLVDGQEQFFGLRKAKPLPPSCRTLVYPHGRRVLCMPGKILYRYHLDEYGTDFKTPVAKIIPTNRSDVIGLYNSTEADIPFYAEGKTGLCRQQSRMPLLPGMELKFGHTTIRVE